MKLPTAAALILATAAALTASATFAQGLPKGDCAVPAPRPVPHMVWAKARPWARS